MADPQQRYNRKRLILLLALLLLLNSICWMLLQSSDEARYAPPPDLKFYPEWAHLYDFYQPQESWLIPIPGVAAKSNRELVDHTPWLSAQSAPTVAGVYGINVVNSSQDAATGFVLEISPSPEFPEEQVRAYWLSQRIGAVPVNAPGVYYVRSRAVEENQRLSRLSNSVRVEIVAEAILAKNAPLPEPRSLTPQPPPPALVAQGPTEKPARLKPAILRAKTPLKKLAAIPVEPPPRPIVEKPRTPSNVPKSVVKAPPVDSAPNRNYSSSMLQFEGSVFSMVSKNQVNVGANSPLGTLVNLRWQKWFPRWGYEARLKTKMFSLNDDAKSSSPRQLEGRIMYRTFTPVWFNLAREMQWSYILGAELFRNPGTPYYSPQYDLFKIGMGTDFKVFRNWQTGGEILYGYGLDASQKFEVSGHIDYFMNQGWSLGAGYRVHFFIAGSEAATPDGVLPFREAYGEAFSVLRWHY